MTVTVKKLGEIQRFDPTTRDSFAQAMNVIASHVEFSINDGRANPDGDVPLWETFKVEGYVDLEFPDRISLRVSLTVEHTETEADLLKSVALSIHDANKGRDSAKELGDQLVNGADLI